MLGTTRQYPLLDSCPEMIVDKIAALEDGDQSSILPIFTNKTCTFSWSPAHLNAPYDKATICQLDSKNNQYTPTSCPIPIIETILIPDGLDIIFTADSNSMVANGGKLHLKSAKIISDQSTIPANVTDNLWTLDPSWNSTIRWNMADIHQTPCPWEKCGFDTSANKWIADDCGWTADGKQVKLTLASCGAAFWPSLLAVTGELLQDTSDNHLYWPEIDSQCLSQVLSDDAATPGQGGSACSGSSCYAGTFPGMISMLSGIGDRAFFSCGDSVKELFKPVFSTQDCVSHTKSDYINRIGWACNHPEHDGENACKCDNRIKGSVKTIQVNIPDWDLLRFSWCVADPQHRMTFSRVPIQRYSQGSAFCDEHVTKMCQNSDIQQQFPVQCRCILKQIQMQEQFANMDLPVQCFMSVCDDTADGVYRTAQQQEGCSAKICQQMIVIHGDSILSRGMQSLTCNGKVYNVQQTQQDGIADDGGDDTTLDTGLAPQGFHFGKEFYVALSMLGVVLLLLILWAINRWIIKQTEVAEKKMKEVQLLTQVLRGEPDRV